MTQALASGTQVGDYILEEPLGRGGFAEVWRARHHVLDQTVALKIPSDEAAAELFRSEIKLLDALEHPNIVKVIAASMTTEPPFLAMELVAGGSLRELLAEQGPSSPEEVLERSRGILAGLAAAHERGIVHGDLKPENILIDESGAPRIADFGLGRVLAENRQSLVLSGSFESSSISGTLDYMAREVKDGKPIDARADLFAFGLLLFEQLAGRLPDVDERPSEAVPEPKTLMAALDRLFEGCYARHERRLPDAGAALELLEQSLQRETRAATEDDRKESPPLPLVADVVVPKVVAGSESGLESSVIWAFSLVGLLSLFAVGRLLGGVHALIFGAAFFGTMTALVWSPEGG